MRRRWLLALVAGLALAASGTLAVFRAERARNAAAPPAAPQHVEIELPAKIVAKNPFLAGAPIEGAIEHFLVDAGDRVAQGQLLAQIRDPKLAEAAEAAEADAARNRSQVTDLESGMAAANFEISRVKADAAQAAYQFQQAGKIYEREKALIAQDATPRLVYEKAAREYQALKEVTEKEDEAVHITEAHAAALARQLEQARAAAPAAAQKLDAATAALSAGEVRSPTDGVVTERHGEEGGQVTTADKDLFEIAPDSRQVGAVLTPPAPVLARIHVGDAALIGTKNGIFPGAVRQIQGGRVLVDFMGPAPQFQPGLKAEVKLRVTVPFR